MNAARAACQRAAFIDAQDAFTNELPLHIAKARVRCQLLETGPPIGVPVQMRIYGPDVSTLREVASEVKARLRSIPGTIDIHDDWGDPVFQMALKIDADRTAMSGLTHHDVATAIDAGLSGYSLGAIREQDRLIDIALRLRPSERTRLDDLYSLTTVNTKTNARMPLSQLAKFEPQVVTPKIRRRSHERCITVRCDTVPGVLPSQIVDQLQRVLPSPPDFSQLHDRGRGGAPEHTPLLSPPAIAGSSAARSSSRRRASSR